METLLLTNIVFMTWICLVVDEPEAEKIKVLFRKQEFYIFVFVFIKHFWLWTKKENYQSLTDFILI